MNATMHLTVQPFTCALCLQIPQLALLYYNNCQHVAHEVLLLPYAFSPHLDSVGGRPVDFLDAARRLREAGRESLDAQVSMNVEPCTCSGGMMIKAGAAVPTLSPVNKRPCK